jgi:hypothetical protein
MKHYLFLPLFTVVRLTKQIICFFKGSHFYIKIKDGIFECKECYQVVAFIGLGQPSEKQNKTEDK